MFRIRDGLLLGTTVVIDANGNLTTNAATATTAGRLSASRTINLTGAVTGTVSTDFSGTTSISTIMSNTAVTPGTYRSVTVTQDGRITSGSNPTTLSGYGITDAQALDAGLTSIAGLTGAGVLTATATNTFAMRAIGVASSTDILDRASADARFAPLAHNQSISTITGLQTALDDKSAIGHQHIISDTTGLQTALDGKLSLSGGTMTGALTLSGDPTNPLHPATKQYVDNASAGLTVRDSARAGTVGNITLSGAQTIDGVSVVAGDRVLVKNQTIPAQNGVYVAATGAWSRTTDMDAWDELAGSFIFISEGTSNANSGWVCAAASGGTIGSTDIVFNQFAGSGNYTAGTGLSLVGNEFSLSGQALSLNNLASDGLVIRSNGTVLARSIVGSTGLTVSNATGVAGNPTLTLATKLSNLSALNSTAGLLVQTGTDTFTKRVLAQGTGVVITNTDGVSGNPTIGLSTSLTSLAGVAWDSGTVIPILTAANTWGTLHTGTGSTDLITGSLGDARYAALSGPTFTGTTVLRAGSTTVAPLRFQAGSLLTTPVAHSFEWNGTDLYATNASAVRKQVAYTDSNTTGSAAKWTTARDVTFTGNVTGTFAIDGSANVSTGLTIANAAVTSAMLASGAVTGQLGYTPANRAGDTFTGQVVFVAGTSTLAPARFQAGVVRTSPIAHSLEWDGTNLFMTTGASTRQTIQYTSDAVGWSRIASTPTTLSGYGITDALLASSYTAADVLAKLTTVDGAASGIDADLLDGQHGAYYSNATNLNAGILPDARLSGTYTGVNITGNAATANTATTASALVTGRTLAITGDLTWTSPSFTGAGNVTAAGTLATVNANVGTFGSSVQAPVFTVNAKGLITAVSNATITPHWSNITSKPTTLSGYGITDAFSSSGGTITGDLSVSRTTQGALLNLSADAGTVRGLVLKTAGSTRWVFRANGTAESGANAGSTFELARHDDAGLYLGMPLAIRRETGKVTFETTPYVSTDQIWHAGNDGAASGLDADLLDGQQGSFYSNATNLNAGIVPDARLSGTYTGINITGNAGTATALATGRTLAITGDLSWTSPSFTGAGNVTAAGTLATVNANVGSFGSATAAPTFTVNAKGLITAAGSTTITPAWSSITSKPTTVSGYGITDLLSSIVAIDGATSGIDADLLDGQQGSFYQSASNINAGTLADARLPTTMSGKSFTSAVNFATDVWVTGGGHERLYFSNASSTYYRSPASHVFRNSLDADILTINSSGGLTTANTVTAALFAGSGASLTSLPAGNLTGSIAAARLPAFTGDITTSAGAVATTLATVNSNVGSFGSATATPTFTVNAKGLLTAAGSVTITPAWSSITSTPTTLSGYGITDAQAEDAGLTSIAGLTGTGVVTATATDTFAMRAIGVSSSIDIPDRAAADGRYARVDATNSFPARQTIAFGNYADNTELLHFQPADYGTGKSRLYISQNAGAWRFGTWDGTTAGLGSINFTTTANLMHNSQTIWTAGNDGAASGLDADLLDGQQGSFYQSASNLNAGTLLAARMPALTGDITTTAGAVATTLATVNANVGSFGTATAAPTFTVNAKGLITAAGTVTITPAWGSITSKPTTVSGYGITDLLTSIQAIDGVASGIDSDLLDGQQGAYYSNATNLNAGTLPDARLSGTYTGVSITGNAGTATALATGRTLAITGDLSWTSPSFTGAGNVTAAGTLATVNSNVGSFGSATAAPTFTVNAKGLITAAGSTTITPAWSSITSKPTTLSGYGITDAASTTTSLFARQGAYSSTSAQTDIDLATQEHGFVYSTASNHPGFSGPFISFGQLNSPSSQDARYIMQIAGDYLNTGNIAKFRTRNGNNSTWNPWRTIWNDGNDGAGSGLDSDLLDGQEGSYYSNATNLNAGTLPDARLSGTYTGVNITGSAATLTTGRTLAITGDLAWTSPSFNGSGNVTAAGTLATVNANVGSFGSTTAAPTFTVNAKGLITAAGSATITPAWSSITSKPTTISGYGITDLLSSIVAIDGAASGIDSDLLDGQQGSYYLSASNLNAGTISDARLPTTMSNKTISDVSGGYLRLSREDISITADEVVGRIEFFSNDTQDTNVNAYIQAIKDDGAVSYAPMALTFVTGTQGAPVERLRIASTGNVGVGTTTPLTTLNVSGANRATNSTFGQYGNLLVNTTDTQAINVGGVISLGGMGSAGAVYTYANIAGRKENATTGNAQGYLAFETDNNNNLVERMRITSAGNVGIGTTDPKTGMHVRNSGASGSTFTNNTGLIVECSGTSNGFTALQVSTAAANNAFVVTNAGNVGVGNATPTSILHLGSTFDNDATTPTLSFGDGDTGFYESADDQLQVSIAGTQKFSFIGTRFTSQNGAAMSTSTSSDTVPVFIPTTGALGSGLGGASGSVSLITGSTSRLFVASTGEVGIGTSSPIYQLEVNGAFAATTKSFVINHPTKENMKLRYGSLEGPENGVYVRGRLTDSNVIELPDYWSKLVDPDSITVTLTPIGKHQKLYVDDISNNQVTVGNDGLFPGKINCFYTVFAERADVDKLVVEIKNGG